MSLLNPFLVTEDVCRHQTYDNRDFLSRVFRDNLNKGDISRLGVLSCHLLGPWWPQACIL